MLQSEFYESTGVRVSLKEYQAIKEVYYNFPGDKDEFCKSWCKMNAKRVKEAKAARKAAEKEAKQKERLMSIMNRMYQKRTALRNDYSIMPLSVNFLSEKDQRFLESVGFQMELTGDEAAYYGIYRQFKRIDETVWEIRKYLKLT